MKSKKAAMEMSVGTIVTIVLLMSVLILGIFLVNKIFGSATNAIDLTDQQLEEEINKLFGNDEKFVIYPKTGLVEVEQGELAAIGIGIKNLLEGEAGTSTFSYTTIVADTGTCIENEEQIENWLSVGKTGDKIPIRVGDLYTEKIRFKIPEGNSICLARFRVEVYSEGYPYASKTFDVEIKK